MNTGKEYKVTYFPVKLQIFMWIKQVKNRNYEQKYFSIKNLIFSYY
jgi:hypothetical protein